MTLFIVISGYCLGLKTVNGKPLDAWRFYYGRFRRIVPPVWGVILLAVPLAWARFRLIGVDLTLDPVQLVKDILLLNDFWPDYGLAVTPLWSVGLEFKIYLLFPVLVWLYRRTGVSSTLWVVSLFSVLLMRWNDYSGFESMCLWYVLCFALGFIASQQGIPEVRLCQWMSLVVLVALLIAFPVRVDWNDPLHYHNHYLEIDLALSFCSLHVSVSATKVLIEWLSNPSLVALGTFSYSIYLVHSPVLNLLKVAALQHGCRYYNLLFLGSIYLSVFVGYLFYLLVERRF